MARSMDLIARLIADTKQFQKGMKDAELSANRGARNIEKMGRSAENLGKNLSKFVTLPIVAVGAAAVKMSLDFESTFAKMQGLAGVAAGEVEGLKSAVLSLAGEVGKSPQELAEALYFIRSAGIDGAAAMETLEYAAKGASAGLGSTIEVANAVTSALNAYGEANLTAAQATDVLVATAREGKAEAADLAPQFGKLLPVASELGVTFDQVGAGLAFLSRTSGSAELSATLLSNVMSKLLKPSKQANDILQGVGLTLEDVQRSIREDGLLATLQALREQLPRQEFVQFFEDAQAVQGALAFTGEQAAQAREVFDALADSAGATDNAFAKFAETAGFKNAQAFARLQAAMIQIGDVLVPIVADIAEAVGKMAGWFSKLPGPVKSGAVAFAALAAAAGPVLVVAGKIIATYAKLRTTIVTARASMVLFGAELVSGQRKVLTFGNALKTLKIGAVFAVGAYAVQKYNEVLEESREGVRSLFPEWQAAVDSTATSMDGARQVVQNINGELERTDKIIRNSQAPWDADKRAGLKEGRDELIRLRDATQAQIDKANELAAATGISTEEAFRAVGANRDLAITQDTAAVEINGTAEAFDNATDAAEAYTNALQAQFDPFFGLLDAVVKNRDARAELTKLEQSGKASASELAAAQRDVAASALDVEGAAKQLNAAVADQPGLLTEARETLNRWVEMGLISAAQAKDLAGQLDIAAGKAKALDGVDPTVEIHVRRSLFDRLINDLNSVAGRVYRTFIEAKFNALDGQRAAGGPVMAGKTYLVGEKGPELFTAPSSGHITPNSDMAHSAVAGRTLVIPISIGGRVVDEVTIDALDRVSSRNGAVRVRTRAS